MAENVLSLAVSVFVLMVVLGKVKGDPTGKFWCNCSDYNSGGRASDYYDKCDAQCQPTKVALETSAATPAPTTVYHLETSAATAAPTTVYHFLRKKIRDRNNQIKIGTLCVASVDGSYGEGEGKGRSNVHTSTSVNPFEQTFCQTKRIEEVAETGLSLALHVLVLMAVMALCINLQN